MLGKETEKLNHATKKVQQNLYFSDRFTCFCDTT